MREQGESRDATIGDGTRQALDTGVRRVGILA